MVTFDVFAGLFLSVHPLTSKNNPKSYVVYKSYQRIVQLSVSFKSYVVYKSYQRIVQLSVSFKSYVVYKSYQRIVQHYVVKSRFTSQNLLKVVQFFDKTCIPHSF
jgi:hypothetical protein